ncbi:MAG: hypothetical protein QNJ14_15155 [Woeseiaceae bacterium]|nr:hypothetical protein [Woeseiaceae bacterium]
MVQASIRNFLRLESAGGIILGSLLSGIMGYIVLHLSLPRTSE